MNIAAAFIGYLLGSIPTAGLLGRLWGVDLRAEGTKNPGANNARQLAGYPLAATILITEMAKGALAVVIGQQLGGDVGAIVGGIGAIAGNVYNVWYRFSGGKGLAISGGVILAAWPTIFPIAVVIIIGGALATRSSGKASLIAIGATIALSLFWWRFELPTAWGVESRGALLALSSSFLVLLGPKHLRDARHPISSPARRRSP